jgi:hypothetical protein
VLCLIRAGTYTPEQNLELVLVVGPTDSAKDHFERVGCLKYYSNNTLVLLITGRVIGLEKCLTGLRRRLLHCSEFHDFSCGEDEASRLREVQ